MRAIKEELVVTDCDIQVPVDQYMNWLELGFKKLNPDQRQAVVLRFWEPFSIAEVADHMRITWDQADRLIDSAVLKIREIFNERLRNSESDEIERKTI